MNYIRDKPHFFSVNDQIVKFLGFAGHTVSLETTTQLCCSSHCCHGQNRKEWACLGSSKILFTKSLVGQFRLKGLLDPILCNRIVSMLKFLNVITVLWLCKKVFLWFGNIHHGNTGG